MKIIDDSFSSDSNDEAKRLEKELAEKLKKMGADCQNRWMEPWRTQDHGELLYDELGLPK